MQLGYYDGVIFHRSALLEGFPRNSIVVFFLHCYSSSCRVVPGFLVQTGDKTSTGVGGGVFLWRFIGLCPLKCNKPNLKAVKSSIYFSHWLTVSLKVFSRRTI